MLKSLQDLFVALIALKRRRRANKSTSALAGAVSLDEELVVPRCIGCGARIYVSREADALTEYCADCLPLKTGGWL